MARSLAVGAVAALGLLALGSGAAGAADRDDGVQLAQADDRVVRLCNRSQRAAEVAKAVPTGRNTGDGRPLVESQGWYHVAPGECVTLYGPGLTQRYYYYYAQTEGGTWAGTYSICVSNRAFTIVDAQCGEGYMRRNFSQIDMGAQTGSFTINLR